MISLYILQRTGLLRDQHLHKILQTVRLVLHKRQAAVLILPVHRSAELRRRQQYNKPSVLKRLEKEHAIYIQRMQRIED